MCLNRPALEPSEPPPSPSRRGALHRERAREGVTVEYDALSGRGVVAGVGANALYHVCDRALSSSEAMSLTFFNSPPRIPKKVAIWTICARSTKSFDSEQNCSNEGTNSRQPIALGIFRPR